MNYKNEIVCAWSGWAYALLFVVGLAVAGFIPPPSPYLDAEQIHAIYIDRPNMVRTGMLIALAGQGLYVTFTAVVTVHLRRIEGLQSPLSFAQLGLGVMTIFPALMTMMFQTIAAFRPTTYSPEISLLLSDMTWIPFVGAWFTGVPQWLLVGIIILQDKREHPIFPRWLGYVNIWVAILSLPSTGLYFLKTGPFAWDGLFSFWMAGACFFGWVTVMAPYVVKAIKRQHVELNHSRSEST